MTSEELHVLGRRAVACKGWRWLGGMKVLDSFRVVESVVPMMFPVDTPDLADPATLGCLLALVREAWGDECAGHTYDEFAHGWFFKSRVRDGDGGNVRVLGQFRSETETLVAALEAAP